MNKNINIYIDMDGVQTVYNSSDLVEDMMKPGYFLSREAHPEVIEFIRKLDKDPRFNVSILSAVFSDDHSIHEKTRWLNAQGLSQVDRLFVPCGIPKSSFIANDSFNLLIDDFSTNLFQWEAAGSNFLGIKFLNEDNGNGGTWKQHKGATLNYLMTANELAEELENIIDFALCEVA